VRFNDSRLLSQRAHIQARGHHLGAEANRQELVRGRTQRLDRTLPLQLCRGQSTMKTSKNTNYIMLFLKLFAYVDEIFQFLGLLFSLQKYIKISLIL